MRYRTHFKSRPRQLLLMLLLACMTTLLAGCGKSEYSDADMARNDLGVAQMGRFEYKPAHATFKELVADNPGWLEARINLAIATLNRQNEGDEKRALELALGVLAEDPEQIRAQYLAGLVNLYVGNPEEATTWFTKVVSGDPEDAYAAYFLGQSKLQSGDYEAAAQWLTEAAQIEPYLRSAYWAGAQAMRRVGRDEEATKLLADYQRFEPNPAAKVAGFSYKRMGPKAEAQSVSSLPRPTTLSAPSGALFAPPETIATHAATSLTTADVDGDGMADLIATGPDHAALYFGTADGFEGAEHVLVDLARGRAPLWGDVNDDGLVDVVLCGAVSEIRYQTPDGTWNQSEAMPQACTDGALFDADHDGDLDVFITGPDGNELFSNNRDGTFRRLAGELGINGSAGKQVLVADLDADRDVDILVLNGEPPHHIWQNDRTWNYVKFDGYPGLFEQPLSALTFADLDANGHLELYASSKEGILQWPDRSSPAQPFATNAAQALATADLDGDGTPELIHLSDGHLSVIHASGSVLIAEDVSAALAVTLDGAQGPGLATLEGGQLVWRAPGPGRHSFLTVRPSGKSEAEQMRSNASGIGTKLRVRTQGRWSNVAALDSHSGPGQSLAPLSVGLGGADRADYIALEWSDGVTQTEINLLPGLHDIDEVQRQLASCPVIFAWDGDKYGFVTDVLGVAGLGSFVAPGQTASPRPFERYLLRESQLKARDGRYAIKLTEPMEENAYLDAVNLTVLDLPPGVQVALDERMGTGGPVVTGRPIFWRKSLRPLRATGWGNTEVLAEISQADRKAPHPGPVDNRFLGLLAEPQVLTLEFGEPLPEASVLLAEGWVEYGYSQTVFAAWQAGIQYDPPDLAARRADGTWVTVEAHFGSPAGMPRQMPLPLQNLPAGTTALRLTSNMEIYWDEIQVVQEIARPESVTSKTLQPEIARVARTGFALRTNGPQRVPYYDYETRSPYWDTKSLRGFYSALGNVHPLVAKADGALAIIGGGEEIHLEFGAPAPPADGYTRHFVVDFRGWAKDMDLYTTDGETVGPLPEPAGLDRAARDARDTLHARYNVRFQEGF